LKTYAYVDRVSLDDLRQVERPDPEAGAHDIVIKMQAASLNYRDIAIARGHYHIGVSPPLVPLSDGAGEVVAVGSHVKRFRVGDLACALYLPNWIDGPRSAHAVARRLGGPNDGVLCEYLCLNEEEAVRAPAHLSAIEACTLPVAAVTAWRCLYETGSVRPGETVAVLGSGGVSTTAIQIARAGGAQAVAVTRRPEFVERFKELGATDVILGSDTDAWPQKVVEATRGGADVVVDVLGGKSLQRSIAALRMGGGTVHQVGYAADTSATFDIFDAIRHGATIRLANAGSRSSFESVLRVFGQQRLKPAVDSVFPVAEIHTAFERLTKGGHFGKIVVTF
jgi:NADPH:quinone reductase-like Zn-dependent oxidoreductase